MRVAVIIVTYNSARYVPDCLGALAKMRRADLDTSVIVVDNASADETVSLLADYPFAELHLSPTNLGFAGGNNLAIRMAMERGADYVYLLNADTEVEPDFLVQAVTEAQKDARIGAVQSLLLLSPDKHLVNSTGNAVHFLGFGYCLDYRGPADAARKLPTREIAYGSGAGLLLRCSALGTVGLLDEELWMYHEDLDLGWRLQLAGWKNVCAPSSVIFHKYEFSRSIKKYYWMERNRFIVAFKNLRVWSLMVLLPWMLLTELPLMLAALRGGWWREKLRAWGYFWQASTWRALGTSRKATARLRTVGDREIVRLWRSTISYQEVAGPFTRYVANPLMTFAWAVLRVFIV